MTGQAQHRPAPPPPPRRVASSKTDRSPSRPCESAGFNRSFSTKKSHRSLVLPADDPDASGSERRNTRHSGDLPGGGGVHGSEEADAERGRSRSLCSEPPSEKGVDAATSMRQDEARPSKGADGTDGAASSRENLLDHGPDCVAGIDQSEFVERSCPCTHITEASQETRSQRTNRTMSIGSAASSQESKRMRSEREIGAGAGLPQVTEAAGTPSCCPSANSERSDSGSDRSTRNPHMLDRRGSRCRSPSHHHHHHTHARTRAAAFDDPIATLSHRARPDASNSPAHWQ